MPRIIFRSQEYEITDRFFLRQSWSINPEERASAEDKGKLNFFSEISRGTFFIKDKTNVVYEYKQKKSDLTEEEKIGVGEGWKSGILKLLQKYHSDINVDIITVLYQCYHQNFCSVISSYLNPALQAGGRNAEVVVGRSFIVDNENPLKISVEVTAKNMDTEDLFYRERHVILYDLSSDQFKFDDRIEILEDRTGIIKKLLCDDRQNDTNLYFQDDEYMESLKSWGATPQSNSSDPSSSQTAAWERKDIGLVAFAIIAGGIGISGIIMLTVITHPAWLPAYGIGLMYAGAIVSVFGAGEALRQLYNKFQKNPQKSSESGKQQNSLDSRSNVLRSSMSSRRSSIFAATGKRTNYLEKITTGAVSCQADSDSDYKQVV